MRIFGGHDYYDTALAFGHDPTIVFTRGTLEVSERDIAAIGIERADFPFRLTPAKRPPRAKVHGYDAVVQGVGYNAAIVSVIVAARRYNGVMIEATKDDDVVTPEYFWHLDPLNDWLGAHKLALVAKTYSWYWRRRRAVPADTLETYFVPSNTSDTVRDRLIDRRWTILTHVTDADDRLRMPWTVDQPVLEQLAFYRAVPPNLLFQEIEMWVGGVLPRPGNEMARISDAVRMAKHGMDKTSFRKPKQS